MFTWKILPLLVLPAISFADSWEGEIKCPEALIEVSYSAQQYAHNIRNGHFTCRKTKLNGEDVITYIDSFNIYPTSGDWGIQVFDRAGVYKQTLEFPENVLPNQASKRHAVFFENGSVAVLAFGLSENQGLGLLQHVDFYDKNLNPLVTLLNIDRRDRTFEIDNSQLNFEGNQLIIAGNDGQKLAVNPAIKYEDVKQAYMEKHIRRALRWTPLLADNYLRLAPRYQVAFDACAQLAEGQIERCLGRAKRPFIRELKRAMDPIMATMTDSTELRATRAYFRRDNSWDSGSSFNRVFTSNLIMERATTLTFMPLPAPGQGAYALTLDGVLIVQERGGQFMNSQFITGGGFSQNIVEWDVETNPNMELK